MNHFLKELSKALKMVWLLFPAILFILISLLLFSSLDQGRDVLLIAVQNRGSALLLILAVTFLAFINWYSSRLIVYIKAERSIQPPDAFWFRVFPRVLGYFTFFATEAAIIYHPYFGTEDDGWWVIGLFALQILIYWLVYRYYQKRPDYKRGTVWVLAAVLVAMLLVSYLLSAKGTIQRNFVVQLISLWVVQTVFLAWNYIRRKQLNEKDGEKVTLTIFKRIKIITLPKGEVTFFRWFNIAVLLPLAFYILAVFSGDWARNVGPFNIVMLSFGVLTGFLQIVSMITIWRSTNFHFLLWVLAIVLGFIFTPYKLRNEPSDVPVYSARPTLKDYTQKWMGSRLDSIKNSTGKYPVYFVLSDGGASRSGYWVASALGRLETATGHKFSQHLFCLSGASGGSVGNAVFYALLDSATRSPQLKNADYNVQGREFLKSDFLSSTLVHMLGPDYFQHIAYMGIIDRGAALEESMEHPNDDHFMGNLFAKKYAEYINSLNQNNGQLPVFYINTTRVKDGKPGVVANVAFDKTISPRIDVLSLMDDTTGGKNPFGSINFSSAAILSARFPYISPAVNVDDNYFVDGGYFDNSGAGIVLETIAYIQGLMNQDSFYRDVKDKIEFNIVHISNSEGGPTEPSRMHPLVNDLFTPLLTLGGSFSQQTNVNNDRLKKFVATYANTGKGPYWTRINLYDVPKSVDADTTGFSMNWVISDTTLRRMNDRINANTSLKGLITTINGLH